MNLLDSRVAAVRILLVGNPVSFKVPTRKPRVFLAPPFSVLLHTFASNLYHSREMSEQPGVRARRQPERLHPGNHLKNLKNRADTFPNALVVIAEEPESAESQEAREYSDLDFDGLFSGEIFLRTSLTQCNNGKNKRRPETLQVKFYHNSGSAESKELAVGWHDLMCDSR